MSLHLLPLETLASLVDQHVAPTFVVDDEARVIVWNRACAALTGVDALSVIGTGDHWKAFYTAKRPCLCDLVLSDTIELASDLFVAFSNSVTSRGAIAVESWCEMPAIGRRAYLAIEAMPIVDKRGRRIGVMETVRDITKAKDDEAKLLALAGVDGLTGLANRRSFDDRLAAEWRRALRSGAPLSMLLIDIDHFKQFNDSLGHMGGDKCLSAVARTIAESLQRSGDVAARYGGEEFVVILPDTDNEGAAMVAEKIRANVEERAIRHPTSKVSPVVTASIGVSTLYPRAYDRIDKIVLQADTALYQAKERGRNKVCVFYDDATEAVAEK